MRTVTLPLLAPGLVAAAMLAFALSLDDFVISNFNSGTTVTFPLYIFGAAQRGIPVEVNVLATMIFGLTVLAMIAPLIQQTRAEKLAAVRPDDDADTGFGTGTPAATPAPARPPRQLDPRSDRFRPMIKGFKEFIMRGNVVDLAVAVVIGAAFGARRHLAGGGPADAADRGDHRQAGLLRPDLHDQRQQVLLRRVHQRADRVPVDRGRRLLLRRRAAEQAQGAGRGDDTRLPRVHERDPARGQALPAVHGADPKRRRRGSP